MNTLSPDQEAIIVYAKFVRRLINGCERPHLRTPESKEITDELILQALRKENMVPSRAAARLLEARRFDLECANRFTANPHNRAINQGARRVLTARINELRKADPDQLNLL